MTVKPSTTALMLITRSLVIPTTPKRGSMRCETAGSPTQPSARLATVMPTWHTERLESRSRSVARDPRPRAALLLQLHEPRLAHAHQPELGGDEKSVQAHKNEGHKEVKRG